MLNKSKLTIETYKKLKNKLNKYAYHYYELNTSLVSDYEYDYLYRQLEKFEEENPEVIKKDSPTQRIGWSPCKTFKEDN